MIKIIIALLGILTVVAALVFYACCVAAGKADRWED